MSPTARCGISAAYIPELAARPDDDPNLTDGGDAARANWPNSPTGTTGKPAPSTSPVTYLMRALG